MNSIPLDELLKKVDSRYSLVVAAAKRARLLTEENLLNENKEVRRKTVSRALEEISLERVEILTNNQ
ncbi:MAG: DNA-directed RNA polymerase subunit omega [Firmicutes bacterium]|nr:DNA-directed RNA polymerase subunit omega [Bacillota bacterium]